MLNHKTISLIIPAHNEAENIGRVLKVVTGTTYFDEIIVVADVCTDETAKIAADYGAKVLAKPTTKGKGDAMICGAKQTKGDIIMFADADLLTLTPEHVKQILTPVAEGRATMSVGMRDRIFGLGAIIPSIFPMWAICGERAMTRDFFFAAIDESDGCLSYGMETKLNYFAKRNGLPVSYSELKNLRQVIKEKKWGILHGFHARLKLMWQLLTANLSAWLKK